MGYLQIHDRRQFGCPLLPVFSLIIDWTAELP